MNTSITKRPFHTFLLCSIAAVGVSACGGGGGSSGPENRPPVLSGTMAGSAVTGVEYASQLSATDPDGDTLSWSVSGAPAWLALDPVSGRLLGIPTLSDAGTSTGITMTVSDGAASASAQFDLSVSANIFASESVSVLESNGPVRIPVRLQEPADIAVVVNYDTRDGSATELDDYLPLQGSLTFSPGQRQQFVEIELVNDGLFELDELFEVVLTSTSPYVAIGEDATATATILNDDPMPSLSASRERIFTNEGSTLDVEFELSAESGVDTRYTISAAGVAQENVDFALPIFNIIPAGTRLGTVSVAIFADLIDQFDQATTLTVGSVDYAHIDESARSTEIVIDDWRGTVLVGTAGTDEGWAVDIDNAGGIFVAGRTTGSLYGDYDGSSFAGFAERRSRVGELQWGYQAPTSQKLLSDAALDSNNNLVLVGLEAGAYFVEKLDPAGLLVWKSTIPIDGLGSGRVRAVAIDSSDNVIIAGWIGSSFDGNPHLGRGDATLAKFGSDGQLIWSRQFGSSGYEEATGVTVDAAGAIYVIGYTFEGDVDGGGVALNADTFLAMYDADGYQVGIRQYRDLLVHQNPELEVLYLSHLKFADDGFLYATGATTGTVGEESFGSTDIPIAKIDLNGQIVWITQVGTTGVDSATTIGFLSDGGLIVGGYTTGAFEGATSNGGRECLVLRVDQLTGDLIWATQFGSPQDDEVRGLAVSDHDEIFVTGFAGGDPFQGQFVTGQRDAMIVKLDSLGNPR